VSKNIDRRLEWLEVELTPDDEDVLRIEVECIGQPELNKVTEVRSLPRRIGGTLQSEV
jgi:hypothetical protein